MSSLQIVGAFIVAIVLWRVVKRSTAPKSPLADVAGPEKEHWLKGTAERLSSRARVFTTDHQTTFNRDLEGNFHRIFQDGRDYNLSMADHYGGVVKVYGLLGQEQLYVSDPRALHHIVVKEQHIYEETDMFIMGNKIIFGEGLISTLGEQHKKQRKMLNPVFSLANMRILLPIIQPIADKLRDVLTSQVQESRQCKEIDVLPWMTRGTLEYISQAGLGYSFNALEATKSHPYTEALKSLAPTSLGIIMLRPLVPVAIRNFSLNWRNKLIDWLPIKGLKKMREIVRVMDRSSRQIFQEKKDALGKNTPDTGEMPVEGDVGARLLGKDIMSILLNANTASEDADRLTEAEILGQMNTIIFAGFETTTTAICRILYILASNPEVQARLRSELREARLAYKAAHGLPEEQRWEDVQLPYDALVALPYLDAVVRETLRVHPPTSLLSRVTRQPTTLPLQYPVRAASGEKVSSVAVPEGTTVIISILAANHNKDVWGEDASVWKPERWLTASGERIRFSHDLDGALGENQEFEGEGTPGSKTGVKYPGVYASMMTFIGGGRACIGFKFAEMEMKQIITALISTLHFSLPANKEIYWKINGLQVPVVRPPYGDGTTPAVPLDVRLVRESDF